MTALDKTKASQAEVRLRDERVGILLKQSSQKFIFKYDEAYLIKKGTTAISIKFPLTDKEYTSSTLHAFFDNLIMEGWLLNQAEKNFHIDKKNRWALLMLIGANPIGAISVHALDEKGTVIDETIEDTTNQNALLSVKIPQKDHICSFCLKPIKSPEEPYHPTCYKKLWGTSKALFAELDKATPLLSFARTINDGSISGAQRKGLFVLEKNHLLVKASGSAYILKPDGDYPELPANEHLTMTAAKRLKFDVPPIGLIEIESVGLVFVIKRFDITRSGEKLLIEDMAQIHEEASDDKYSLSHEKISQAIKNYTQAGPLNLNDFFRRIIFCYVTANGDMHLKNWSLLEMEKTKGIYRLCPVYDWLNTRIALPNEKNEMAIPLNGKQNNMQKSYFSKFATETLGLKQDYIDSVFKEVEKWEKEIKSLIPYSFLSEPMKKQYLYLLKQRCQVFYGRRASER